MNFGMHRKSPSAEHEVNLTPLIDVSLVLVVMLLLATPLAFESSINVRSTPQTAQAAKVEEQNERVELTVISEDSVRVNRTVVARDQLAATLRPLLAANADHGVMIGCEHGVSHGAFVDVLDKAKMCGATELAVFER